MFKMIKTTVITALAAFVLTAGLSTQAKAQSIVQFSGHNFVQNTQFNSSRRNFQGGFINNRTRFDSNRRFNNRGFNRGFNNRNFNRGFSNRGFNRGLNNSGFNTGTYGGGFRSRGFSRRNGFNRGFRSNRGFGIKRGHRLSSFGCSSC